MIIFSHGFGVQQDARGLFTALASRLDDDCRLFDYNHWDEQAKMLKVAPIDEQVKTLRAELKKHSNEVDLICHSQGCLVAALAQPTNVRRVIFLAPATPTNSDRFAQLFTNRPESVYRTDGDSILQRSDGSQTIVPKEYWASLDRVGDVIRHYSALAQRCELHIVLAGSDEIVQTDCFDTLPATSIRSIEGANHNFTDQYRPEVVNAVAQIFNSHIS